MRVDLVDVLAQLASRLRLDLLDLLEPARLHERALGFQVRREDLGELSANVGEDVIWSKLEEGLEGR